ncbi:MAG: hypothetical protein WD069_12595 [Planctomycetales bacterium]
MWWKLAIGAYVFGIIAVLLLWARGLVRANRGDLVLAFCLFAVISITLSVAFGGVPAAMGLGAIALGLETLIVGAFAPPHCPLRSGDRWTISLSLIGLGCLSSLIV